MHSPAISVVMGVYNGADYLAETIDSVLAQTERDFEFIMVNDGSTDSRVADILSGYAHRDQRMQIISKSNEGLTKALICGCAAARGEYIARIDVGDIMTVMRLEKQKSVFDGFPDIAFVSSQTEFCGPEWETLHVCTGGQTPKEGMCVLPEHVGNNLLAGPTHHGAVMFRRSAYDAAGGYRAEFYYGQDWDLWYRLAEQGRFAQVPEVLYRARCFPEGISSMYRETQNVIGKYSLGAFWARRNKNSDKAYLDQAALLRPELRLSPGRGKAADGYHFIGELLRKRDDVRCRRYFLQALRRNPVRINTWVRYLQSLRVFLS